MTIAHQKLAGEDGQPTAALIQWNISLEVQEIIQQEKHPISQIISERVEGLNNATRHTFTHEEAMASIRDSLAQARS